MKSKNKYKLGILFMLAMGVLFTNCERELFMATPDTDPDFFDNTVWVKYNTVTGEMELYDESDIFYSAAYEQDEDFIDPFLSKAIENLGETGGLLLFGEGIYNLQNTVNLISNFEIRGIGNKSVFKITDGNSFFKADAITGFSLKTLKLEGNPEAETAVNAVSVTGACTNFTIEGVIIDSLNGNGIVLEGSQSGENAIRECAIVNVSGTGVMLTEGALADLIKNRIESTGSHGIVLDNAGSGISIANNSTIDIGGIGEPGNTSSSLYINNTEEVTVNNSNSFSNNAGNGINVTNSSFIRIKNNTIASSGLDAIHILSSDSVTVSKNSIFIATGNGIAVSGTSEARSTNITVSENVINYVEGVAAIHLEYLSGGAVINNKFAPGTNPMTVILEQGAEVTLNENQGNEEDNSNPVPIPVCWYKFDTTGMSNYSLVPVRIADFSGGAANFDNGKQWLFDAGEYGKQQNETHATIMDMKHNLHYEKINGKYRHVLEADPAPSADFGLDPNNANIRSWLSPGGYNLDGTKARTVAFWLKIDERAPSRGSGLGSDIISIGSRQWTAGEGINIQLIKNSEGQANIEVQIDEVKKFTVPAEIKADRWYHIVLRNEAETTLKGMELLIDGALASTHNQDDAYDIAYSVTNTLFLWATSWFSHGVYLADLRFYDTYVSDEHISLIMLQ
jgi:hypothetical protein